MSMYLSKKEHIEDRIRYNHSEQKRLDNEISSLKKELTEFESAYNAIPEDLANKVEKLHNQSESPLIGSLIGLFGGYIITCASLYTYCDHKGMFNNVTSVDDFWWIYVSGLAIGVLGFAAGYYLGDKLVKDRTKKLIKEYPGYREQIVEYKNKLKNK